MSETLEIDELLKRLATRLSRERRRNTYDGRTIIETLAELSNAIRVKFGIKELDDSHKDLVMNFIKELCIENAEKDQLYNNYFDFYSYDFIKTLSELHKLPTAEYYINIGRIINFLHLKRRHADALVVSKRHDGELKMFVTHSTKITRVI